MSVLGAVQKHIALPPSQVREVGGDSLQISQLHKAVVLLVSPWSADAMVVLRKLVEVLGEFPSVVLILVDPTALAPLIAAELELAEDPQGYGEAVWISGGAVIGMVSRKSKDWERLVDQNTAEVAATDTRDSGDNGQHNGLE